MLYAKDVFDKHIKTAEAQLKKAVDDTTIIVHSHKDLLQNADVSVHLAASVAQIEKKMHIALAATFRDIRNGFQPQEEKPPLFHGFDVPELVLNGEKPDSK